MKYVYLFLIFSFHILLSNKLLAQNSGETPHPIFSPFEGSVHKMPVLDKKKGRLISRGIQEFYSDTVYTYEKIKDISLNEINIPETSTQSGFFPDIEQKTRFSMVLNSKVNILVDACYEFSLNSDDGSILWIDDRKVVNNDGGHGMRMKKDSIVLNEGIYDVKLWYFQGMADRFGIQLDGKIIGKPEVCKDAAMDQAKEVAYQLSSVHFDHDEYLLNEKGTTAVMELAKILSRKKISIIKVIGHTDSIGPIEYNQKLSLKRAESVKVELEKNLANAMIEYLILGKGSQEPVNDKNTETARKENRRVEIIIE